MARPALPSSARFTLAATFATNVGSGMQMLAVAKLLFDSTGSVASFAGIILLQYLLTFVTTLFAGSLVDRSNPKTICVGVDAARGLVVCLVSALSLTAHPAASITLITLAIHIGKQFQRSALFTLEPRLVGDDALPRYNGIAVTCMQLGQLTGVFLCGLVLKHGSPVNAIFLNGVTFLISAALVALVRVPADGQTTAASAPTAQVQMGVRGLLSDWWVLAKMIWTDRVLLTLLLLSAADYAVADFINLSLVPINDASFDGNPYWLSLLDGSFAVGAIAAGLCVDRVIARMGVLRAIITGTGLQALLYLALLPAHVSGAALVVLFGLGMGSTLSSVAVTTALQLRMPRAMQGKLSSMRSLYITVVAASLVPMVAHSMGQSLRQGLLLAGVLGAAFFVLSIVLLRRTAPAAFLDRNKPSPGL